MRTDAAGCLEVLSLEGQNGDMMMRWEGKEAGGEGEAHKPTFLAFLE